jgi:hypothetical protein
VVEEALDCSETPERSLHRLERFLLGVTRDRLLSPQKCASLWEAYDRVYWVNKKSGEPQEVMLLSRKVMKAARVALGLEE